jgi:phospholipid transport system substrate-binding protein
MSDAQTITRLTRFARISLAALPFILLASTAGASALAETPPSPKPRLKGVIDKAHGLAKQKVAEGTDAETKWRAEAKGLIDDTLDWPLLTESALGKQWKTLADNDKKEFAASLREMIEASYQSKLKLLIHGGVKKPEQVKIEWLDEKVENDEAAVTARVKTEKNVAVIEFKLKWAASRWRVYDVAIDEVSTVRTYRTQFGKIIAKDGFPALLARMRGKIEEIRAGKGEIGP